MQNGLFSANFLAIDHQKFIAAVNNSDSAAIDAMLDAKSKGCTLDLNAEASDGTVALEILLRKHDFTNAAKLLKNGANTSIPYKIWVSDDLCYPYGEFETRHRSVFQAFAEDKAVTEFLLNPWREANKASMGNNI